MGTNPEQVRRAQQLAKSSPTEVGLNKLDKQIGDQIKGTRDKLDKGIKDGSKLAAVAKPLMEALAKPYDDLDDTRKALRGEKGADDATRKKNQEQAQRKAESAKNKAEQSQDFSTTDWASVGDALKGMRDSLKARHASGQNADSILGNAQALTDLPMARELKSVIGNLIEAGRNKTDGKKPIQPKPVEVKPDGGGTTPQLDGSSDSNLEGPVDGTSREEREQIREGEVEIAFEEGQNKEVQAQDGTPPEVMQMMKEVYNELDDTVSEMEKTETQTAELSEDMNMNMDSTEGSSMRMGMGGSEE